MNGAGIIDLAWTWLTLSPEKSRIKLTFLRGLKSLFFLENDARKQDVFSEVEIEID